MRPVNVNFIKKVLDYAFTHSVEELEVVIPYIYNCCDWPIYLPTSCKTLTSLKLKVSPFTGPILGSLKNLRVLYLDGALITDLEPFLGFPVLERLTLICCNINTEGETLSVHAHNLSYLTITNCWSFNYLKLTTPKLRFFEYEGYDFPQFRTYEGLHVLDTIVLDFGQYGDMHQEGNFEGLLSLFCAIRTAKSIRLSSSVVHILSLFQDELVKRSSPF
ncbi:hypothetical protein L2E82_02721 [Cichorium intybus]|uniref:Uncharacterized protein n=1 Tax=Cichorium intybus TaxID=13427 RepID=A0ACB9H2G2_CICIN|nr:hypothetical protein L2E82_02721 [Cichorium intybus]